MPRDHYRALEDLVRGDARPLTTSELARLVGLSATFIRTEIRGGHLRAVAVGRGRKRVYRILQREAIRYARQLGVLRIVGKKPGIGILPAEDNEDASGSSRSSPRNTSMET
jgi:excisionase family DNA binding protein